MTIQPDPIQPELRRELLFQISDASRVLRTYVDQRAGAHGMTRAQWAVIKRLSLREGLKQSELAEMLELQPISLARLLDKLCDQGVVERRAHPTDRRANRLFLTDRGRALRMKLRPIADDIAATAFAGIGEKALAALLEGLLAIKENVRAADAATDAKEATNAR